MRCDELVKLIREIKSFLKLHGGSKTLLFISIVLVFQIVSLATEQSFQVIRLVLEHKLILTIILAILAALLLLGSLLVCALVRPHSKGEPYALAILDWLFLRGGLWSGARPVIMGSFGSSLRAQTRGVRFEMSTQSGSFQAA